MNIFPFVLIVFSAILHTTWNLFAKKSRMSWAYYTLMGCTCTLTWFHVYFWTPVAISTLPFKFWALMYTSILCDMGLYCFGLSMTYRYLDMSTAYPIMRSLPILFTMGVTSLMGWGTPLKFLTKFGCVMVFFGCLLMPQKSFSAMNVKEYFKASMFFVLMAALGTTGYTVLDKQAQAVMTQCITDVSSPLRSLTYFVMRDNCLTFTGLVICTFVPSERLEMKRLLKSHNWRPYVGGICASLTYILVLIAMNYVENVTYVQVFRQISLPCGVLAGIVFLKEKSTYMKWIGVSLILAGLIITVL